MSYRETLPRRGVSRREMMQRVARFSRLKGFDGGPPKVERAGKQSPVGRKAARMAAIEISEAGNAPSAEFTSTSIDELEQRGIWPAKRGRR